MKKLLSVILAGALALTAVSPAFAATSAYENIEPNGVYYDVDFDNATDVAEGGALNAFINSASNGELRWESRNSGATFTKAYDPIKGNVAKITSPAGLHSRLWFDKGNWKNGWINTVDTWTKSSTVVEFSFKVTDPKKNMFFYTREIDSLPKNIFLPTGAFDGSRSPVVEKAFGINGEWNHCVIEFGTYHTGHGVMNNTLRIWINGVCVATGGSGKEGANFSKEQWSSTYLAFGEDAATDATEWYISDIVKYETQDQSGSYKPADAGNKPATITASGDVIGVGNALYYNPAKVTTTTELLSNLTVSTGTTPLVVMETEGEEWLAEAETALASADGTVKYVVAESTSGDQLTYYTVGEQEATQVAYGDKVVVDEDALTVTFKEVDLPTVGDLAAQFTATGGSAVKFFDASGNEIKDTTAAATTVKTVSTYSITGMVKIDYAVSYAPATYSYIDLDWSKTGHTLGTYGNPPFRYGVSGALVDDADMGYKVWKVAPTASTTWGAIANGSYTGKVTDGDKFIIEATVKPHTNKAGNLFMTIKNLLPSYAVYTPFEFSSERGGNTITLHGTSTYPFVADKWYHIVSEYTVSASGSVVNQWVNGVQVTTEKTIPELTTSHFNTQLADDEQFRLAKGHQCTDSSVAWSVARYSLRQSAFDYNEVTEGDATSVTTENEAITIDTTKAIINVADTAMTVEQLKAALTVSEGATVKYLGADGAEVADTAAVGTVKSITVLSQSKNRHVAYDVTNLNVKSDVYKVTDGAISGVKMYTTVAQLKDNLSAVENIDVLMADDKWISNGDVVTVGTVDYTVSLEDVAHNTGSSTDVSSKMSNGNANWLNEDGIHVALANGTAETVTATGLKAGDSVYKLTDTKGYDWRWVFSNEDNSNGGSGNTFQWPTMEVGETRNIEFSIMTESPSGVTVTIVLDNQNLFAIEGTKFGRNQNAVYGMNLKETNLEIGKWTHVVVSVCRKSDDQSRNVKVWVDGELVNDARTIGDCNGEGMTLKVRRYSGVAVEDAYPVYIDDIKYYEPANSEFDADWQYGLDVKSNSNDVVLANDEVWLSNGATVEDAIWVDIYNADGSAIEDYTALAAGDVFFVKAAPIIKKYTVKEGALGTAVDADGTLTATVGMVDDLAAPAIFVAGIGADNKFTNIVKVKKASSGDDTIVYDLNSIGDDKVKVYVWDASLTSLTDVATYTKTAGSWN